MAEADTGQVMRAIMRALPAAMFGCITTTVAKR
jgi:hypothetical protein